jgi:hypothetical protein
MKLVPKVKTGAESVYRHCHLQAENLNYHGAERYIFYVFETNMDPNAF